MAVCKDCGTQVGFMKKRCAQCQEKYDKEQAALAEQRAQEAAAAAAEQAVANETSKFEQAKQSLQVAFDKFEGTSNITSPNFRVNKADYDFVVVNGKKWFLRITQKRPDWMWLNDNRTIILFEDGNKLVMDHGVLSNTDVGEEWGSVIVLEEHHVVITDAIPHFLAHYEAHKIGSHDDVPMRIGPWEYPISFNAVRTIAAMAARAKEQK